MKLGSPTKLEIKLGAGKTEFQFLLTFPEQPQQVEFVLDDYGAMLMMAYLQRFQVRHKIPIPDEIRPSGKPRLRVVTSDE